MADSEPVTLLRKGLTWEQMADGKVWRLKGGKHFRAGHLDAVRREALAAGETLGKAVRTLRDDFGKWHYLWVQFADYRLAHGHPCPKCGSDDLRRLDDHFARCMSCQSLLMLEVGPEAGEADRRPNLDLARYTEVVLRRYDEDPQQERFAGYGVRPDGVPALLLVDYPLDPSGRRLADPARPGQHRYRLRFFPAEPFGDALSVDALGRPDGDDDEDEGET